MKNLLLLFCLIISIPSLSQKVLKHIEGPVGIQPVHNTDWDLVHGILGSKRLDDDFEQRVSDQLNNLHSLGFNVDVSDIQVNTYIKDNLIITTSSCDIIESEDGNSYPIFTTRGSIGQDAEFRHDHQVNGLINRLRHHYGGEAKKLETFIIKVGSVIYKQSFFSVSVIR